MEKKNFITRPYGRISWGSVFAGVFTALAISVLLSILATSIGLFQFDALDEHPTSGIGITFGIFTAIALLLSFAAGGFVAGKLAGADGMIHGFVVWATTMIATLVIGAMLTVGAVKLSVNILGSVSSAMGNVLSGVGSVAGSGVTALADEAQEIFGDIDLTDGMSKQEVRKDVRDALRKSGVKELQPEYLEGQMNAVKSDLKRSMSKLLKNPNNSDMILDGFLNRLSARTEKISDNVSRDDLARALSNNTKMSKAEAEKTIDEYEELINSGIAQAKEQAENLKETIAEARQQWEETKIEALEAANEASNAAARSTLISFFALLIGAGIAVYMGGFGVGKTQEGYEI